jgi:hypothetical protein
MLSPLAKRNRFYCHASSADKVKSLSPHHRFVIALRSPSEVAETGLRVGPSERKARKLACGIESDTFSGPVCEQKLRNCGYFLRFSGQGSRISLQSRLCGGAASLELIILREIPVNREIYREIRKFRHLFPRVYSSNLHN